MSWMCNRWRSKWSTGIKHRCTIRRTEISDKNIKIILNNTKKGPSPDEVTLVDTAQHYGYQFKVASSTKTSIEINKKPYSVELLKIF